MSVRPVASPRESLWKRAGTAGGPVQGAGMAETLRPGFFWSAAVTTPRCRSASTGAGAAPRHQRDPGRAEPARGRDSRPTTSRRQRRCSRCCARATCGRHDGPAPRRAGGFAAYGSDAPRRLAARAEATVTVHALGAEPGSTGGSPRSPSSCARVGSPPRPPRTRRRPWRHPLLRRARPRGLDPLVVTGQPHLLVVTHEGGARVGPFVVPGPPPACGASMRTST